MTEFDVEVDARGLLCPLPVLRLAKALHAKPPGTVARLLATDPGAVEDVEAFCAARACRLMESRREGSLYTFLVQTRT